MHSVNDSNATEYPLGSDRAEPTVLAGAGTPGAPSSATVIALLGLAVVVCGAASLWVGRGGTSMAELQPVFLVMRAQRVAVAFFCGAALAVSGAIVQGLFRNPLAYPHILGVSSAATFGAHVALLLAVLVFGGGSVMGLAPEMMVPIGALLGALLSLLALLYVISTRVGPLALLLTGYALMSLFQGMSSFLTNRYQEAWELNRALQALNMGNLSASGPRQALLIAIMALGGLLPALLSSNTLDVLLAGEEEATSLGVEVQRVRFWLVLWVAFMCAGTVAVGGSLSFVGLIVPHAVRHFVGQRHRILLPASFLAGGAFVILCDTAVRLLPSRLELPLGVVTDLIGAPFFLRMLLRMARAELSHG